MAKKDKDTNRHQLIGRVDSDVNDKTIIVVIETFRTNPLYGKRVNYSKRYTAHDEKNIAKVGDTVLIAATRPLSKTKRYELVKVIKKAVVL